MRPTDQKNRRGYSLAELMMAVAIIGIMAGLAIPAYRQTANRNVLNEARLTLNTIAAGERMYFAATRRYWPNPDGSWGRMTGTVSESVADIDAINANLAVNLVVSEKLTYTVVTSGNGAVFQAQAYNRKNGALLLNINNTSPPLVEP